MRVFFTADIHGAGALLRKSLRVAEEYSVDLLMIAGDLSGKQLFPVVELGAGRFRLPEEGRREVDETGVVDFETALEARGDYSFRCDERRLDELTHDPLEVDRIFTGCIAERLVAWRDTIVERLDLSRHRVMITPGNDDPWELDDTLAALAADGVLCSLDEPVEVLGHEVVTLDVTNPTPWATPRELPERELGRLARRRLRSVQNPEKAIFNFHCPPRDTRLDLAPKLDENLKQVTDVAGPVFAHVGSSAVREVIEEHQPPVALHGHIHEAEGEETLGRTLCLNPGSEYWTGILHGFVIDLDSTGRLANHFRVEG